MHIKLSNLVKEENELIDTTILSKYNNLVEEKKNEILKYNSCSSIVSAVVELVFFFDKSGSVSGTEKQMIAHLNDVIQKYRNSKQNILITIIVFSDKDTILYYRQPISEVKDIYYSALGGTSLFDSLTKNISNIIEEQSKLYNTISKTIVTIMTDGEDTTSHIYKESDLEKLVSYTKSQGWQYIYLSPISYSKSYLGIDLDHIGFYDKKDSLSKMFGAIEKAIDEYLETNNINKDWKNSLSSSKNKVFRLEKK